MDTNDVKRRAYYEVLVPAGVPASVVDQARISRPRGDRFDVIAEAIRLSGVAVDAARLAATYGRICDTAAALGPEISGASATLSALAPRLPLYVCSATPEAPLRRIVERRGWSRYFRDVFGRPRTKPEILRIVLAREGVQPTALTFVGDDPADAEAAATTGCRYVAFGAATRPGTSADAVASLAELSAMLER